MLFYAIFMDKILFVYIYFTAFKEFVLPLVYFCIQSAVVRAFFYQSAVARTLLFAKNIIRLHCR
jgi:Na+/serine symporter